MEAGIETLVQFYERTRQPLPQELAKKNLNVSHFNVKRRCCINKLVPYNRRDYYKICFIKGTGIYRVMDKKIEVNEPVVIFSNPLVPSSWESISTAQDGYYCLFNDAFFLKGIRQDIKYASSLFNPSVNSIIFLNEVNAQRIENYFTELEALLAMDYFYKNEMIIDVLHLLILEGIRLQSPGHEVQAAKPVHRIVTNFFNLLNKQFPVDSPENPLTLLSPSQYAAELNVHVNHLNAMVKRDAGKSTRTIIKEKIITEAKTLLSNTEWDVSEVAYSLGFEYPSHFNKYFKQYTSVTPLEFREQNRVLFD
jgi:AraC-like DNA-binding protein